MKQTSNHRLLFGPRPGLSHLLALIALIALATAAAAAPAPPLGSIELRGHVEGPAYGVAVLGDYAYLAAGRDGLRVIDVATPATAQEVGAYPTLRPARGVAATEIPPSGDAATALGRPYVLLTQLGDCVPGQCSDGGLHVVDVSQPQAPAQVAFLEMANPSRLTAAEGAAPADLFAYVADAGPASACGALHVVDVSQPDQAAIRSSFQFCDSLGGRPAGVAVANGFAFSALQASGGPVAPLGGGLAILDVSNPDAPTYVEFYGWPSNPLDGRDVAVMGDYAYVATAPIPQAPGGLEVVDIANIVVPVEGGFYDTPGYAESVTVAAEIAYVADGFAGLRMLDLSSPTAPVEIAFYDTPGYAEDVAVANGYIYVAAGSAGLFILSYQPSPPALPSLYLPLVLQDTA